MEKGRGDGFSSFFSFATPPLSNAGFTSALARQITVIPLVLIDQLSPRLFEFLQTRKAEVRASSCQYEETS